MRVGMQTLIWMCVVAVLVLTLVWVVFSEENKTPETSDLSTYKILDDADMTPVQKIETLVGENSPMDRYHVFFFNMIEGYAQPQMHVKHLMDLMLEHEACIGYEMVSMASVGKTLYIVTRRQSDE